MDVKERKWTRVEYERLVEAEILGPEDRVELLGGAMPAPALPTTGS